LFLLLAPAIFAGPQATLYVSPAGGGTTFSLAQPGSLSGAQAYVRTINPNMTGDIVVYLLGGTYQFTNSFQLSENATNHDSGTGGFNIIYSAAPGAAPVISGGLLVTNWTLFSAASNIWRTFVGTGINSRQLYVNGVRAIRARSALNPAGFSLSSAGTGFNTTNPALQSWGNPTNIEIVQRHNWKQLRCPIASISGTNIVMQTPGWTYTGTTPTPGRPWNGNGTVSLTGVTWVENAYELLAGPGMWYLNQATGYLYYIPRPGENLTNGAVVVLPVVEKLIDASGGSLTTPIHNLVFSGLTFEYATWLLPSTGSGYADNQTSIMWSGPTNALKTLGNVSFQTAGAIQITNCVFEHLGGSAVDFGGGAHSNIIVGNFIDDISSDGISVGEVVDYAATDENQMTDGNVIQDNYIRRPGQEYEDAIGIWVGFSKNTIVAHNDVDNTPYTGISLGWGWGTSTYAQNNQVLGNYVGKVMQTLTDGGAVYSLSAQTNSWHIGNYYQDSCWHGIYLDEGSAWWTAVSNVFDHVANEYVDFNSSNTNTTGGVLNNHNNTVTNNFSNTSSAASESRGVNDVISNTTLVTLQFWPPAAQSIILNAGLEPAYAGLKSPERLVNDTEPDFDHVPADWTYASARTLGEYHNDVHYTLTDGQYVQYTFTASGIAWIGELNNDESNVDVYLDGNFQSTVNCYNPTRVAQARLFSATNLSSGPHTLKLVKNGGTYLILDALAVTPVNFWLTATTNAAAILPGNTFSNVVRLDVFNGYAGTTTLSAVGLPAGATATFNPPTLTGAGFSTMTVTNTDSAPPGNYELQVTGIGGGVTNLATVGFTIINATAGFLVWNGGGVDNNWSDAANWGGTSIAAGDSLLFAGTSRLGNLNNTAAGTIYSNLFFNFDAGAFVLGGSPVVLAGNLVNNSANLQTVGLGLNFNSSLTLDGVGGPLILGGGLTNTLGAPGSTTLTLAGSGVLTNWLSSKTSPGGTNVIAENDANGNWSLVDNPSATPMTVPWVISVNNGTFNFGNAGSAPTLTTTTANGAPQDNQVGDVSGTVGTFNMFNGTLTTGARLNTALVSGSTGIVNQLGGTFTIGSQFQGANGSNPGEVSLVTLSGGTMNIGTALSPSSPFYVASRGTGTLTLSNAAVLNCGTLDISRNADGNAIGSVGVVNLNGGTILCNKVGTATANSQTGLNGTSATFNFNGGTLRLNSSTTPFFQGSTVAPAIPISAIVRSGGAVIDSNGKTNIFAEALLHDAGLGSAPDGGLTKNGSGCLILVSNLSYTGDTAVNAGTLALSNAVALSSSPVLAVAAGAALDASGRSDATLTLANGQTLTGNGAVKGNTVIGAGATLMPGGPPGALAFANNLTLNGGSATVMAINKSLTPSNAIAQIAGTVHYGGTLVISNLGTVPFSANDSFALFSAAGYGGAFTNLVPVIPAVNLAWNTNSLATGVVSVVSSPTPPPKFGTATPTTGGSFIFTGTGGVPYWTYYVLASTNLGLPVAQWPVIATNTFGGNGGFIFTNPAAAAGPGDFYLLKLQ
jgi:autotransporter-associated beta strand protein